MPSWISFPSFSHLLILFIPLLSLTCWWLTRSPTWKKQAREASPSPYQGTGCRPSPYQRTVTRQVCFLFAVFYSSCFCEWTTCTCNARNVAIENGAFWVISLFVALFFPFLLASTCAFLPFVMFSLLIFSPFSHLPGSVGTERFLPKHYWSTSVILIQ